MSTISFAKDPQALARGVRTLLVVAPKSAFSAGRLPQIIDRKTTTLALDLARDVQPGDLGASASTLTRGQPARLAVGVLPNRVARYNSASRAESIRRVVAAANPARAGGTGVLLVLDDAEHLLAATNAVAKSAHLLSLKSGKSSSGKLKICAVTADGTTVKPTPAVKETVNATREAARLVDTPPTDLHPGALADEAKALLRGVPHVRFKQIAGARLLTENLGAIHGVGRCALDEPRLLIARYTPPKAKGDLVALVGKGITYDTGGLHLKARGSMEGMKCDMGGAAAVLGAFRVLAASGVKRPVALLLCLAENGIGPAAVKPDDVLTMHSGKTVEINNTDAEGRLVLADGVSYASRVLGARTIIDAATLTGAQMVATGSMHAAVVSSDDALERVAVEAGHHSGDLTHPLPFAPELYKQEFRSPIADMRNSVKNRMNAQASCAAQFIYWHIEDTDARWCHVDLAGPAWRGDRGTGFGVALLSEMVRRL